MARKEIKGEGLDLSAVVEALAPEITDQIQQAVSDQVNETNVDKMVAAAFSKHNIEARLDAVERIASQVRELPDDLKAHADDMDNARREIEVLASSMEVLASSTEEIGHTPDTALAAEEIKAIAQRAGEAAADEHLLALCGSIGLTPDSVQEGGIQGLLKMATGLTKTKSPKPEPQAIEAFPPDRCQACGAELPPLEKCGYLTGENGKQIGVGHECPECSMPNFVYRHLDDEPPFASLLPASKIKGALCPFCGKVL